MICHLPLPSEFCRRGNQQRVPEAESPVPINIVDEGGLHRRISDTEFLVGTGVIECRLVNDRNLSQ